MGRQFVFLLSADDRELAAASKRSEGNLKRVGMAAGELAGHFSGLSAHSQAFGRALEFAGVGAGIYVFARLAAGAVGAAKAIAEAQINADRMRLTLTANFGAERVGREIRFITDMANRLGLELVTTAQSYVRFQSAARGTSLEGERARQAFESVAKAAAVMGLGVEETQGVLRALEQMISKGTVQAEELRGQLGDRMPGALQIAARAMGVTTEKLQDMVQNGEVLARDFIPRFARQLEVELGGAAEQAGKRMEAALNRAGNAWERFKQTLSATGAGEVVAGQVSGFTNDLNAMSDAMEIAKARGNGMLRQLNDGLAVLLARSLGLKDMIPAANTLDTQLAIANKTVAELQGKLDRGEGGFYMRAELAEAVRLRNELERIARLRLGPGSSTAGAGRGYGQMSPDESQSRTRAAAEDETRIKTKLGEITDRVSGVNKNYAASLRAVDEALSIGLIKTKEAIALKAALYQLEGGGAKAEQRRREAFQLSLAQMREGIAEQRARNEQEADLFRSRAEALRNYRQADLIGDQSYLQALQTAGDEYIRWLEASKAAEEALIRKQMKTADPTERAELERQLVESNKRYANSIRDIGRGIAGAYYDADAAAAKFARDLTLVNQRGTVELIADSHERARAIAAIEIDEQRRRVSLFIEGTAARKRAEDALADYIVLRNAQLTEELKPEWQRQLEAWSNTTRLMRETHADFMRGFVEEGRQAFSDFLETGKVNTRSLVNFIGRAFADLAYKRYLAQSVASLGDLIFGSIGSAFGLGGIGSGGGAISQAAGGGSYSLAGMGARFGRALGGPVKAGGIYPVNEFDTGGSPGELLNVGGSQYLMARRDGYVTPRGGAGDRRGAGGGVTLVQNVNVHPVPGVSPAMMYAAVEAGMRQANASALDSLQRGGDWRRAVDAY